MANILTPTQGLSLKTADGGVSGRATAFTPNQQIAFQRSTTSDMSMMNDAIEAITKHLEDVQKQKQESLVNQASSLYQEAVRSEQTRYQNLQGENAINGLEEYQKNITDLNKQFAGTFKNSTMQQMLSKEMENTTLNARINGRNWHDKQVYEFAKTERLSKLESTGDNFIYNIGSPNDKNNLTEMQKALDNIIKTDHGVIDPNSEMYKQLSQTYYDKAFKAPLGAQIDTNPSMARVNLERVKDLISPELYASLSKEIKQEQKKQYNEYLTTEKLKLELQEAQDKKLNDFWTKDMNYSDYVKVMDKHYDNLKKEFASKHGIKVDDITENQKKALYSEAKELADAEKDNHDAIVYRFNNQTARMTHMVQGSVAKAIESGSFNRNAPLACLDEDTKLMVIDRLGSEEKAEKFLKERAIELYENKDSTGGDKFYLMTKKEQAELAQVPVKLEKFYFDNKVSMKDQYRIDKDCKALQEKIANGEELIDTPILKNRDRIASVVTGKETYKKVTDPKDIRVVGEVMDLVQTKLSEQYQKTKDPSVYSDSNIQNTLVHIKVYDLPKIKQQHDDFEDCVDDVYSFFKEESYDNEAITWTNEFDKDQRKQFITEKGLEYKKRFGYYPTADSLRTYIKTQAKKNKAEARRILGASYWGKTKRENSLFNFSIPEKQRLKAPDSSYNIDLGNR